MNSESYCWPDNSKNQQLIVPFKVILKITLYNKVLRQILSSLLLLSENKSFCIKLTEFHNMFFCQISQILIPCLDKWCIFFLVNLVICCRVMTVSAVACSQQVKGMGNAIWYLHGQIVPKQLCWCLFHLLTFFVLFYLFFSLCL